MQDFREWLPGHHALAVVDCSLLARLAYCLKKSRCLWEFSQQARQGPPSILGDGDPGILAGTAGMTARLIQSRQEE
jgi:hypothetical protein